MFAGLRPTVAILFVALLCPTLSVAQTPSQGLAVPDPSVATTERATAIDTNPAGLAAMRELELGFGYVAPSDDLRGVTDEGYGAYLGAGVGFLGVGFSAQRLKRPTLGLDRQSFTKYSTGIAAGIPMGRVARWNFGVTYHTFGSADDQRLDELSSVQVGTQVRLSEYLAIGVNAHDINRPFLYDGEALPVRYESMAGLRFWDGRILIDAGVRHYIGRPEVDVLTRLAVEPVGGFRFFAASEFNVVDETDDTSGSWDYLSLGAELSLGTTGFEFGTAFERRGADDRPAFANVNGYVWAASAPKKRAIFDGTERWVSYDLNIAVSEGQQIGFFAPSTRTFATIVTDFEAMANDDDVTGVFIKLGSISMGYAQAWEIRQGIKRLRENGKKVVAYMSGGSLRDYYLASAADEVWATPASVFEPGGLKTQFITAAGALRMAGLEAQFVRIGDYKTAPELFVRDTPSKAAIEQREAYLEDFHDVVVTAITEGRGIERGKARELIEKGGLLPQEAVDAGYIDKLVYRDELDAIFEEFNGGSTRFTQGYSRRRTQEEIWRNRPEIAVVIIEGTIVQTAGGGSPFSTDSLAGASGLERVLNELTSDNAVKAIVLRIDSPGGSAFASDALYRAIRKAASKKPVIASMGNTAASGGYYVAVGADEIVAAPTTVTGSIGVFSGKFNIAELAKRIGINISSLKRGNSVRFGDFFESWDEEELKLVGQSVSYLYQLFLKQAAATRPLTEDELDAVARGRVWTGRDAREKKLVDHEGGLLRALRLAEEKAGLKAGESDYQIYPESTFVGGVTDAEARDALARYRIDLSEPAASNEPATLLSKLLGEAERLLLMPLVYANGEPMMLPFEMPVVR